MRLKRLVTVQLSILDRDDPCAERWDGMVGYARVRFCERCRKHVFDVSAMRAMSATEARALIEEYEGAPCAGLVRRADGTATAGSCAPIRYSAACDATRRTVVYVAGIAAALITAVFVGIAIA